MFVCVCLWVYTVQLVIHYRGGYTLYSWVYTVQVGINCTGRYSLFKLVYTVQVGINCTGRYTLFKLVYTVQVDIPCTGVQTGCAVLENVGLRLFSCPPWPYAPCIRQPGPDSIPCTGGYTHIISLSAPPGPQNVHTSCLSVWN